MALIGYSELEEDGVACIKHYISMKRGDFESVLAPSTGEAPHALAIRTVGDNCRTIGNRARKLLERHTSAIGAGEVGLSAESLHNLTEIAEEMDAAADEAKAVADADEVWKTLPIDEKKKMTQYLPVDRGKADLLRARIRLDRRKQKTPPTDPPANAGNAPKP